MRRSSTVRDRAKEWIERLPVGRTFDNDELYGYLETHFPAQCGAEGQAGNELRFHNTARWAIQWAKGGKGNREEGIVKDVRQRSNTEISVIGDRYVVLATPMRRQAHVTARFPRDGVLVAAQGAREIASREVARKSHELRGDHFFMDEMEPNDARPLSIVEMTADGVSHGLTQLGEVVGFGDNRRPNAPCDESPFGIFIDNKYDFGHGFPSRQGI